MQKKGGGSLPDYKLDFPLKKSKFNIRERKKHNLSLAQQV